MTEPETELTKLRRENHLLRTAAREALREMCNASGTQAASFAKASNALYVALLDANGNLAATDPTTNEHTQAGEVAKGGGGDNL